MIKVSVIIPIYNAEKYISQCLESLLNQTLLEIEIICVNDSSTDGTLDILNRYAKKNQRIKVISQENAGAGAARNRGLSVAKGEYLSILDADDFFEPNMLEEAFNKAINDKADIVVFKSDQYYEIEDSYKSVNWTIRFKEIPPYTPFSYRQMTDNIFKVFVGWTWDKIFKRSFVEEKNLEFQEQRTSNDLLFTFSAIALAKRITVVDKVLVHQRRDSKDSLSKTREKSWDCFFDALMALKERLILEDIYEEVERDFINYSLHFSLWNLNTVIEPTYTMIYNKLRKEWFEALGVFDKPCEFFYNQKEYCEFEAIMKETR